MPTMAADMTFDDAAGSMAMAAAMPAAMAMEDDSRVRRTVTRRAAIARAQRLRSAGHLRPGRTHRRRRPGARRVSLPDNLTRYRIMVVAVADGKHFGTGEANLTARLPLMVRPSAPRFLNFGDRFELPVVLQNQTDEPLTVDVAVEVGNLQLDRRCRQRVTVPANDRVEVRFPAETVNAGTARLRIAAVAGDIADAANGRAAGLHAGHHRGLCDLRRGR